MGPLDGIQVLELGETQAGCLAGMLLGDYGANIIRIENPHAQELRSKPGFVVLSFEINECTAEMFVLTTVSTSLPPIQFSDPAQNPDPIATLTITIVLNVFLYQR